jgi:hypothetical protein
VRRNKAKKGAQEGQTISYDSAKQARKEEA